MGTSVSLPAMSATILCASTSIVTRQLPADVRTAVACFVSNVQKVFRSNRSASSGLSESGVTAWSSRYRSSVVARDDAFFSTSVRSAPFTRASPTYSLSACIAYGPLR